MKTFADYVALYKWAEDVINSDISDKGASEIWEKRFWTARRVVFSAIREFDEMWDIENKTLDDIFDEMKADDKCLT